MKSEIKKGAILGYVNMIANILITFFYIPIMIKMLGQQEYGLYSLVSSVIAYLSVLDMGFGNAMVRFVSRSQAQKDKNSENRINGLFLFLYVIIGFIALLIGTILMQNIKKIFGASLTIEELNKAKVIMAILLFTVASSFPLSVFDSYVMACEKFTFLKVLNILKTLAIPLTMLPLLFLGYKSIAMVIINSLFTLLYHVGTLIYCKKKLKMKLSFSIKSFDKKLFKEISFYSVFIFLNIIVDNLFNNTDQVILGSICGTTAVSIYAIGSRISSMNVTFSTTISGLFLPRVTKMIEEKNSDKELSNLFIKVARIQIYLMVLILSGFIIYGKAFINLWVGNSYADAYWIILLLIGPALIPLTQNLGISIIQAKNKHQFRSVVYIIIAILNVIISIPLAKKYQGIGAAIGTAIANVIGQIITMNIFYWKKINIDIPKYWKNLIIFIIPVGVLSTLNIILIRNISFNWIKLVVAAILYLCAYFMIVFNYMNEEERKYIRNIRQKFFYDRRKK